MNDSDAELTDIARFLASVSPDIPWHVTAFHPDYKMQDPPRTSVEALLRAVEIGDQAGLRYVYAGNLPGHVKNRENTYCPGCRALLIERFGFRVRAQSPGGRTLPGLRAGHSGVLVPSGPSERPLVVAAGAGSRRSHRPARNLGTPRNSSKPAMGRPLWRRCRAGFNVLIVALAACSWRPGASRRRRFRVAAVPRPPTRRHAAADARLVEGWLGSALCGPLALARRRGLLGPGRGRRAPLRHGQRERRRVRLRPAHRRRARAVASAHRGFASRRLRGPRPARHAERRRGPPLRGERRRATRCASTPPPARWCGAAPSGPSWAGGRRRRAPRRRPWWPTAGSTS